MHRIEVAIREESRAVVVASQNMARTFSGAGTSTNSSFPLVSVPLFEIARYTARHEADIEMMTYTPVLSEGMRNEWQRYSADNSGWIEESRQFLGGKEDEKHRAESTNTAVRSYVWQMDEVGRAIPAFPSPYLPIWQVSSCSPT